MALQARPSNISEYHGIAVADKADDSRELWVYSEEILPFVQGELKGVEQNNEISTTNGTETYRSRLKTSNAILCTYKDDASNRAFPPDVRKGEQVTIFNIGDTDTWYWRSDGRNDNARRTERMRLQVGNTLENNPTMSDDNTYFIEMDSRHNKRIRISTSDSDGEACRYIIDIDASASEIMIADNVGNMISIESLTPRVCMKNKDDSLIDMNAQNITIACKGDISILAEKNILMKAGMSSTLKAGTSTTIESGTSNTFKSGTITHIEAGTGMSMNSGGGFSSSSSGNTTLSASHVSVKTG